MHDTSGYIRKFYYCSSKMVIFCFCFSNIFVGINFRLESEDVHGRFHICQWLELGINKVAT